MTATVLDDRLLELRAQARHWAEDFRAFGTELDRDPDAVTRCTELPGVRCLAEMIIPAEYGGRGVAAGGHRFFGMSALERAVVLEEFACGDAGVLLAAPGASMSGVLVDMLGDEQQKEWFYGSLLESPKWTFFAVTEPARGSDANALETALEPVEGGDFVLSGRKKYVGNAARARLGVVFARTRPGPLGVTAVLVDTTTPGFRAEPLDMIGLRGARICAIDLDSVAIPAGRVLGRHLSPTRRGMWACARTFNRLRPGVAAIALGIARAAYEYVLTHRRSLGHAERDRLDRLGRRIDGARHLVHLSAVEVDADAGNGFLASAAKADAARLAEDATLLAAGFFGPRARWEHPALDKLTRDARGVEFMEGTGNIQKLNVFHGVLTGKLGRDDPFPAFGRVLSTGGSSCG
ncbi:acyl-CoA dehydrogenase family protein [Amycolatopsis magusensis]|uniref:Alkylation response protein AidB-like acyl-CoA dehydrogenase n=1 Tax=Amycolatopsis magusensis TaxID=882444 RepID=A0ABS4Q258_9PSEU|nr:acyl-CoA dehydrogenase family protein [Amycolatopsis magusensis]MBP2184901.1 alkylation response protein AidB-like acyl-CoA dehydrogenase [Amycolatopsis magusensis]